MPLKKACKVAIRKSKNEINNAVFGLIAPVKQGDKFMAIQVVGELKTDSKGVSELVLDESKCDLKMILKLFKAKTTDLYDFVPYF